MQFSFSTIFDVDPQVLSKLYAYVLLDDLFHRFLFEGYRNECKILYMKHIKKKERRQRGTLSEHYRDIIPSLDDAFWLLISYVQL